MCRAFSRFLPAALAMMIASVLWNPGICAARQEEKGASALLVSTAWLAGHLNDRSLALIHIGPKEEFEAGHIPGAQFLSLKDISSSQGSGLRLELPAVGELKATLERIGISDTSRIIICFGKDWVTPAARVFFTLDFAGLGNRTSILDGGLPAWQAEGRPVTKEVSSVPLGSFTPHPKPSVAVDAAWLQSNLHNGSVAIIDARLPEFYTGANAGGMKRAGHIPGAVNIPFSDLVDNKTRLKNPGTLGEMFKAADIKPGSHVVAYCHIGQQASLVYFVAKLLGYEVSLYDGSFEDWSARSDLPVATAKP